MIFGIHQLLNLDSKSWMYFLHCFSGGQKTTLAISEHNYSKMKKAKETYQEYKQSYSVATQWCVSKSPEV